MLMILHPAWCRLDDETALGLPPAKQQGNDTAIVCWVAWDTPTQHVPNRVLVWAELNVLEERTC